MKELQKSDDAPDPVTWYGLVWRIVRTAIESNANLIRVCILICLVGGVLWLIASVVRLGSALMASQPRTWRKSSLSISNGDCVEVAHLAGDLIRDRDSRDVEGPILRFTPDEWRVFVEGVKHGDFDGFERPRAQW